MRKPIFLVAFSILLAVNICNAQNSIITNIAGNGSPYYNGDGGLAISAAIGTPTDVVFDNSGNIYIADGGHAVIRKINTSGIITTIAGNATNTYSGDGGPATAAGIGYPINIAIDNAGNIYISDGNHYVIRKVNTVGIITTFAGNGSSGFSGDGGPATAAQFTQINGVAVDGTGNVYLSDISNARVRKVNTSGIVTTIAGGGSGGDGVPATASQLSSPKGIKTDILGNIYLADQNKLRKINASGIINTIAGNFAMGFSGDGGPATAALLNTIYNLAISPIGEIYISDRLNFRVRKVNAAGIISTVAGIGTNTCGGYGGPATSAGIDPFGITCDCLGQNIYFAGASCYYIHKVINAPDIVSDSFSVYLDKLCNGLSITAIAASSSPLNLKIFFGDNSYSLNPLSAIISGSEYVNIIHPYAQPGTYTLKMILLNGTTPIDSATYSYKSLLCNTFSIRFYYDANSNCLKENSELFSYFPILTEVDSNGIAIDTISATSGFDYTAYGAIGDIYSFKVLSAPPGLYSSCPLSGVILDTLQTIMYDTSIKSLALSCSSTPGFDLAEYVGTKCGRHRFEGDILINNTYCNPQVTTFTTNFSSKYSFQDASPTPISVTGNIITWNLSNVSATDAQPHIHFTCEVPGAWLTPGDTVNTDYTVTPTSGDVNTGNNYCVRTDTVKSSYDPNEMSVTPAGIIPSGTQLQYTIEFENTGNDTAHNIYVMDTLSSNVIPSSLRILASSAVMNIIPIKAGGYNIVKFDFPNIKLLDSSHHNQCNGMVLFTINTRTGLSNGTTIFNHAGIFFDDNPVVMTNTVEDIIYTEGIAAISNISKVSVYPNPATDELTIKMDKDAYNLFTITNSVGQIFMQQQLSTTQTTVNVKTLPTGLYYITLRGENGTKVQKFVKM